MLLANHYLDVVRGLPTLRAFNRSHAQTASIADVSEQYRRTTMSTLRVGFLSGSVLELAATLGVALVAVTVGVRLDDGRLGLQAGLTVLLLAPELYLPLRQLGAQFHTSADGLAVAERILELIDERRRRWSEWSSRPSPAVAAIELRGVSFAYPSRPAPVLAGLDLTLRPRRDACAARRERRREEHGREPGARLRRAHRRRGDGRRSRACDQRPLGLARAARVGAAAAHDLPRHGGREHPPRATRRLPRRCARRGARSPAPTSSRSRCRSATRRSSATAAVRSPRASGGESRWPAPSCAPAPLLVLDEPTADLDPDSEALVAAALERLRGERTILLITHREELARVADRVVVLVGRTVRRAGRGGGVIRSRLSRSGSAAWPARARGRPGRADDPLRCRVDGDRRLPHLARRRASCDPVARRSRSSAFASSGSAALFCATSSGSPRTTSHFGCSAAFVYVSTSASNRSLRRSSRDIGSGDLLSRVVADVDSLQFLYLRGIVPALAALLAGCVSVAVTAAFLPAAAVVLADRPRRRRHRGAR